MLSESRQYVEVAASLEQRKAMAALAKEFTKKVADKTYKPIFEEWSRNYFMQDNNRVGYKAKYCNTTEEMHKDIKEAIEYLKTWMSQNFKASKSEQELKIQNQVTKKFVNSSTNTIVKISTRERMLVNYKHFNPQEGETLINKLKGYNTAESKSEYGGVSQRWILIESQERLKSDIKKLDKKIQKIQQNSVQELKTLALQDFACVADAIAAAEKLSTKIKWHELSDIQTIEKPHYAKRGKPQPDAIPICAGFFNVLWRFI